MHYGNCCNPQLSLRQRFARLITDSATPLKSQQRRHRLQIVLHPMVDFANGGVLGHERALSTPDLSDVTQEEQTADIDTLATQWDALHEHRSRAVLKVGTSRRPPPRDKGKGLVHLAGPVGEAGDERMDIGADDVGHHTQSPQRTHPVRARVRH